MKSGIAKSNFGKLPDGTPVEQYTLTNSRGTSCKIITYGGIITELDVPDREGEFDDVVLGFDNLDSYLKGHPYFGAICGRCANRIAKGKFTLDGMTCTLATNNGPNHLHGGVKGFDKMVWKAEPSEVEAEHGADPAVKLSYTSPDGEEGYPGTVKVTVIYSLSDDNELQIRYLASTDKPTPVNLTNHSYFNLAGGGDIFGHELMLKARKYTPADDTLIPTGEVKLVKGTPFDFTSPKPIGRDLPKLADTPMRGYDHNFVLDRGEPGPTLAARVYEPTTGRILEVFTDQPGMQLYTSNFLKDTVGKGGRTYRKHGAVCLETQHFPDSINHPAFPPVVLRPGKRFDSTTTFRFSVR